MYKKSRLPIPIFKNRYLPTIGRLIGKTDTVVGLDLTGLTRVSKIIQPYAKMVYAQNVTFIKSLSLLKVKIANVNKGDLKPPKSQ